MVRRKKVRNIAQPKPISEEQARAIANKERELSTVKLDFDTVVKRIADGVVGGLYYGSPPGFVQ
jgi:hypothetical protein